MMERLEVYLQHEQGRYEDELAELLRIPSVSTDPQRAADVARAADFVARLLADAGARVTVFPTAGHPIVYAEQVGQTGAPTLLIYGHYDVQPADPLDQWVSPPFEPTVRQGNLYARGASDDKGQMFAHIKALEAWTQIDKHAPVNVKFLIEGEEEIGSLSLPGFLASHRDQLRCDYAVISDGDQFADGVPAITCGLRGLAYFEVVVQGPRHDLHSGLFGGAVDNPAMVAARLAASLQDAQGRIALEGFYDRVVEPTADERRQWAALPFDEEAWRADLDVPALAGEPGYSTLERRWARPTCDVHGLWGGYAGEGTKTIIPARAGFKVSFRLVPDQDPAQVAAAFQKHIRKLTPPTVRCEVRTLHASPAVVVASDSAGVRAARRAVAIGFGREPVLTRAGGSIPVVGWLKEKLGTEPLLVGFGLPDDNCHGPNEKFRLADLHRAIRTSVHLMRELAVQAGR